MEMHVSQTETARAAQKWCAPGTSTGRVLEPIAAKPVTKATDKWEPKHGDGWHAAQIFKWDKEDNPAEISPKREGKKIADVLYRKQRNISVSNQNKNE